MAASTGKNERTLQREGLLYGRDYRFTITYPVSHVTYYPGAEVFALKTIFRLSDGKLLGAQAMGKKGVDKCIDTLATVLRLGGTVEDLIDLELSYAPPFGAAKAPANMAGYFAEDIVNGLTDPILPHEVAEEVAQGAVIIDIRSKAMHEAGHIPGAINIPTEKLRSNLQQLDKDKTYIIACVTGLNGYFMERMLRQKGYKARNLIGGHTYYRTVKGQ